MGIFRALALRPALTLGVLQALLVGWAFSATDLYGDDTSFLLRWIPALDSWRECWAIPSGFRDWFGPLHRPLSLATWRLDHLLFGEQWPWHHAHHSLWAGAVTASFTKLAGALVRHFSLVQEATSARRASWWAGILFLAHPAHVETFAWLATRHDLVFGTFFCCALIASLRCLQAPPLGQDSSWRQTWAWPLLAASLAFLAIQAKETGYAWFVLHPALVLLARLQGRIQNLDLWRLFLPALLALVAAVSFRFGTPVDSTLVAGALDRWLEACSWALQNTILPQEPRLYWDPIPLLLGTHPLLLLLLPFLAIRRLRSASSVLVLFGTLFWVATLAPTWPVAVTSLMSTTVADRYLFMPVGGFLIVLLPLFVRFRKSSLLGVLLLILWLPTTLRYAAVWAGPLRDLGLQSVRLAPDAVEARLGGVARSLRVHDLAGAKIIRDLPTQGLQADHPSFARMHLLIAVEERQWDEARKQAQLAVQWEGDSASRWSDLGQVLWRAFLARSEANASLGGAGQAPRAWLDQAAQALSHSLELDPRRAGSALYLGYVQASLGNMQAARVAFATGQRYGGRTTEGLASQEALRRLDAEQETKP